MNNQQDKKVLDAALKGINYFSTLQADEGQWPGEYGGPMFLMPGAIITLYITDTLDSILPKPYKQQIIQYLRNQERSDTGGWGIDIERHATQFGTVLNYVALRLLGVSADDGVCKRARQFIHNNGGAVSIPSWGKFWLACLGVYEWDGYNSVLPELWLTPYTLNPIYPGRWWCHCRMVYLPMAYCYGARVVGRITPLVQDLRNELYIEPYNSIDWISHRDNCCKLDLYFPQTKILKVLNFISNTYEKYRISYLRNKSLEFMINYIHAEDDQTKHVCIGPVNKFANMLSVWHYDGSNSKRFKLHCDRVLDYFWLAEDGMKCNGYNGSQLWDTAFITQAICESSLDKYFTNTLHKAYNYIDISQVQEDVSNRVNTFRHISDGGWPFSTNDHGWPISDCTGEGLKATLLVHQSALFNNNNQQANGTVSRTITDDRIFHAVNVILSFENSDGSYATYELTRSYSWLEYINPAELFGGIMIDYGYVECTSSSVQALCVFRQLYPHHRTQEINQSIERSIKYIQRIQRDDGSWYGSWAVCFTYGIWFGIEALVLAGYTHSDSVNKACKWLVDHQNNDGGWGESYQCCVYKKYIPHPDGSQVVNTAWACLALIAADYSDRSVIDRGIQYIISQQYNNGDWPQQGISGVFNNNCMITYINYRCSFTIWALGRYLSKYVLNK